MLNVCFFVCVGLADIALVGYCSITDENGIELSVCPKSQSSDDGELQGDTRAVLAFVSATDTVELDLGADGSSSVEIGSGGVFHTNQGEDAAYDNVGAVGIDASFAATGESCERLDGSNGENDDAKDEQGVTGGVQARLKFITARRLG